MPETGLEPVRTIRPQDFKSWVSTNSTTRAIGDERIRTADRGFADLGLTTWRRRHNADEINIIIISCQGNFGHKNQ
jgi:hypothetical protein